MKKKGFTLVELLAVIVILAIIALIATPTILGVIEKTRKKASEISALNYIDAVEKYMVMNNLDSEKYPLQLKAGYTYQVSREIYEKEEIASLFIDTVKAEVIDNIYLNDYIKIKGDIPTKGIVTIGNKNTVVSAELTIKDYFVVCEEDKCEAKKAVNEEEQQSQQDYWSEVKCEGNVCESNSILDIINYDPLTTGYYTFKVEGIDETKEYPVHLIVYEGNQEWNESMTFGDANDISDGTNYAQNMVIVKVKGNLTIGSGTTISPISNNYGGPKGFTLFITGKLTNNGTIDNSHGAYAEGENVYLWKNADNTFEYVPAVGAIGGASATARAGNSGETGIGRETGGGGSGASSSPGDGTGVGGSGTSYSGGTGGGARYVNSSTGVDGSNNGGPGGSGTTTKSSALISTGVGNPSGTCLTSYCTVSPNGTGGLLVIYADEYENNGLVTANGTTATASYYNGGSSGGGSINIFTNQSTEINQLGIITDTKYSEILGVTSIVGGTSASTAGYPNSIGGAGGAGTVNIGSIRKGQYYDLKEIINQDKEIYKESVTIKGNSILSIVEDNKLQTGYYTFKVEGINEIKEYPVHLIVYEGNQEWNESMTFGDANDISDGTNYAQNMVIVKVKGDLTIGSEVTISPLYNNNGGPKGFTLFVTGKLTNNGTIDNSHGAYAEGENVYLWKNADNTFEYVPAVGAIGGTAATERVGKTGEPGSGRETGGGGSGASSSPGDGTGVGGSGTSYSGGTGGGARYVYSSTDIDGSNNGGIGGAGGSTSSSATVSTGVGNLSGTCLTSYCKVSPNGTGGLLVIYSNEYENNGTISATGTASTAQAYGGGSSGGGSINIFYKNLITEGTTNALGGSAVGTSRKGGAGGTGTVTYLQIK